MFWIRFSWMLLFHLARVVSSIWHFEVWLISFLLKTFKLQQKILNQSKLSFGLLNCCNFFESVKAVWKYSFNVCHGSPHTYLRLRCVPSWRRFKLPFQMLSSFTNALNITFPFERKWKHELIFGAAIKSLICATYFIQIEVGPAWHTLHKLIIFATECNGKWHDMANVKGKAAREF